MSRTTVPKQNKAIVFEPESYEQAMETFADWIRDGTLGTIKVRRTVQFGTASGTSEQVLFRPALASHMRFSFGRRLRRRGTGQAAATGHEANRK